jgi:hypothetical protein
MTKFWLISGSRLVFSAFASLRYQVFLNQGEVGDAKRAFNLSLPGNAPWSDALPSDFPNPKLYMPVKDKVLVDFIQYGTDIFVSEKLKNLFALSSNAASWVDCEVSSEGSQNLRYWLFHPRSFMKIVDIKKSAMKSQAQISAKTGEPYEMVSAVDGIRFFDGLEPCSPVFFDQVLRQQYLFITDSLAKVIVAKGCTGIDFLHPLWLGHVEGEIFLGPDGPEQRVYNNALTRVLKVKPVDPSVADLGPSTSSESVKSR